MQQQMDGLKQTHDPQQRRKLLDEHRATMQSAMSLMDGMQGPGMIGGSGMMGWSGMRGYYSTLTPEQLKQRQYVMDKYSWMQPDDDGTHGSRDSSGRLKRLRHPPPK